jgi:hypothetical protein
MALRKNHLIKQCLSKKANYWDLLFVLSKSTVPVLKEIVYIMYMITITLRGSTMASSAFDFILMKL